MKQNEISKALKFFANMSDANNTFDIFYKKFVELLETAGGVDVFGDFPTNIVAWELLKYLDTTFTEMYEDIHEEGEEYLNLICLTAFRYCTNRMIAFLNLE